MTATNRAMSSTSAPSSRPPESAVGPAVPPRLSSARSAAQVARPWASGRFVACLTLLLGGAVLMELTTKWLEVHLRKQPVPLRKPLYQADGSKLLPEYELHPIQPQPLPADTIEALGTDEYLNWRVVDLSRPAEDPLRVAHVFVTYYTGRPDAVPHTPDECLSAAGAQLLSSRGERLELPGLGLPDDSVPVRVAVFRVPQRQSIPGFGARTAPEMTVLYFFHTNGKFRTTRQEVRLELTNLFERFAYYSKVEVSFASDRQPPRYAETDESLAALGPLLRKLLPILLNDHFQDWESFRSAPEPGQTPAPAAPPLAGAGATPAAAAKE